MPWCSKAKLYMEFTSVNRITIDTYHILMFASATTIPSFPSFPSHVCWNCLLKLFAEIGKNCCPNALISCLFFIGDCFVNCFQSIFEQLITRDLLLFCQITLSHFRHLWRDWNEKNCMTLCAKDLRYRQRRCLCGCHGRFHESTGYCISCIYCEVPMCLSIFLFTCITDLIISCFSSFPAYAWIQRNLLQHRYESLL